MTTSTPKPPKEEKPQLLHLVFGGELKSLETHEFRDVSKIDVWACFPTTPAPSRPGGPRRSRRSTAPRRAISSSTCTA